MFRLFHQSSHLGDEFLLRTQTQRVNLSYESVDLRFSYEIGDVLRLYGGGGLPLRPGAVRPRARGRCSTALEFTARGRRATPAGGRSPPPTCSTARRTTGRSTSRLRAGIQIDGVLADAQSADPARVLQRPLAQRPVLQGQDRVLRPRHPLPLLRSRMSQDLRASSPPTSGPSRARSCASPSRSRLEYDVMALVLEYERRRRFPILLLEQVRGSDIPIVCNVVASRRALAFALGVPERALAVEYARRIKDTIKPVVVADPPFRQRVLTGRRPRPGAAADPHLLPGRRRPLPHRRHAGGARSRDRRGDGGLSPLPAEGPRPHGREPALAAADVRVPAPRRGARAGAAVRHRARPAPARLDGLARLPAGRRRQVRGGGRPARRAARGRAVHDHRPARAGRRRDRHRGRDPARRARAGRARSASSPATSRAARPSTSSWPRRIVDARAAVVPVDRLRPRGRPHHHARPGARGRDPQRAQPRDPQRHRRPRAAVGHVVLHRLRRHQAGPAGRGQARDPDRARRGSLPEAGDRGGRRHRRLRRVRRACGRWPPACRPTAISS